MLLIEGTRLRAKYSEVNHQNKLTINHIDLHSSLLVTIFPFILLLFSHLKSWIELNMQSYFLTLHLSAAFTLFRSLGSNERVNMGTVCAGASIKKNKKHHGLPFPRKS